eukprot:2128717-Pleurochrysis_carterae.AAC.1
MTATLATTGGSPASAAQHAARELRLLPDHHHPLRLDGASKRKRFFCDVCGQKGGNAWRCSAGCDYGVCNACSPSPEMRVQSESLS